MRLELKIKSLFFIFDATIQSISKLSHLKSTKLLIILNIYA